MCTGKAGRWSDGCCGSVVLALLGGRLFFNRLSRFWMLHSHGHRRAVCMGHQAESSSSGVPTNRKRGVFGVVCWFLSLQSSFVFVASSRCCDALRLRHGTARSDGNPLQPARLVFAT